VTDKNFYINHTIINLPSRPEGTDSEEIRAFSLAGFTLKPGL
jgi:hypothetical protein